MSPEGWPLRLAYRRFLTARVAPTSTTGNQLIFRVQFFLECFLAEECNSSRSSGAATMVYEIQPPVLTDLEERQPKSLLDQLIELIFGNLLLS